MIDQNSLNFINVDENDCAIILIHISGKFIFAFLGHGSVIENSFSTLLIQNEHLKEIFVLAAHEYINNN